MVLPHIIGALFHYLTMGIENDVQNTIDSLLEILLLYSLTGMRSTLHVSRVALVISRSL
jgi:hypothetical protein